MNRANELSIIAFASGLLVIATVWHTPQGLYSDPAWQLEAMQEYIEGYSPTINHSVTPRADDLSRNDTQWGVWWPPATQLLIFPLASHGIPIGTAVRWIVIGLLLMGAVGWARWIALFDIPMEIQFSVAFLFPWIRFSSNALFLYSAEIVLFASSPWFLLIAWRWSQSWWSAETWRPFQWASVAIFGVCLGARYICKYSGVLFSVGIIIFLVLHWFRSRVRLQAVIPRSFVLIGSFAVPVLVLSFLNLHLGHAMNGASLTAGLNARWQSLIAMIANPALAFGDVDACFRYFLLNPNRAHFSNDIIVRFLALPGSIMLFFLLSKRPAWRGPGLLAMTTLIVCVGLMGVVWNFAHVADYAARHLSSPSLAILPLAMQEAVRLWNERNRPTLQTVVLFGMFFYVAVPLSYGYISVFAKVIRTPIEYVPGDARIYNPMFATSNVRTVQKELLSDYNAAHDLWYLTDPITSLDLPGREIVRHADFMPSDVLEKEHFRTLRPLRIKALLPMSFEENGKGDIIRGSFEGAQEWKHQTIEGSNFLLWSAELTPATP